MSCITVEGVAPSVTAAAMQKQMASVPDHFGTAKLIPICSILDNDYATLGMSKEAADAKLGANISAAVEGAGYNHWIAEAVGAIYKAGVQIGGAEAYAKAQAQAAGNH